MKDDILQIPNPSSGTRRHGAARSSLGDQQSKHPGKGRVAPISQRRHETVVPMDGNSQPSEEDLFYLLINKLRQREENEAAFAALKDRMKEEIHGLTQENEDLKAQLQQQEYKQESDINTKKEQMERWKTKLTKLNRFLNGLGKDHDSLRNDFQHLKAAQTLLSQEKESLTDNVKCMKADMDVLLAKYDSYPGQLRDLGTALQTLEHSLRSEEGKSGYYRDHLVQEQNRVLKLENHIQNLSSNQARQLGLIEKMQLELVNSVKSLADGANTQWLSLQLEVKSMICPAIDKCVQFIDSLQRKELSEMEDLKQLNDSIVAITTKLVASSLNPRQTDC